MKWFAKYWLLKIKYDKLMKDYLKLVNSTDKEFWEGLDHGEDICSDCLCQ